MTTRRGFFKQFIGQVGAIRDDIKGVEKIPLNRLNELPETVVGHIRPVLFPREDWSLEENQIILKKPMKTGQKEILLDKLEMEIFQHFKRGTVLKQIAEIISSKENLEYSVSYQKVTSLFFRLAPLRICHPEKFYNIDEIINSAKNRENDEI